MSWSGAQSSNGMLVAPSLGSFLGGSFRRPPRSISGSERDPKSIQIAPRIYPESTQKPRRIHSLLLHLCLSVKGASGIVSALFLEDCKRELVVANTSKSPPHILNPVKRNKCSILPESKALRTHATLRLVTYRKVMVIVVSASRPRISTLVLYTDRLTPMVSPSAPVY